MTELKPLQEARKDLRKAEQVVTDIRQQIATLLVATSQDVDNKRCSSCGK